MTEDQRVSVVLYPTQGVRVNRSAVVNLLRRIAENEIDHSPFLSECGITVVQNDDLRISYAPRHGVSINKSAVTNLIARMLRHEISQSSFLTSCGIQLAVHDMESPMEEC
jgi:hypothetical protein